MAAPRKYSVELQQTRMAMDARKDPELRVEIKRVAGSGFTPEALRNWVRQAEIDGGVRAGTTTDDATRLAELECEVRELRRANEIHAELNREGVTVAKCTAERLMRAEGLRGIPREKTRKTRTRHGGADVRTLTNVSSRLVAKTASIGHAGKDLLRPREASGRTARPASAGRMSSSPVVDVTSDAKEHASSSTMIAREQVAVVDHSASTQVWRTLKSSTAERVRECPR